MWDTSHDTLVEPDNQQGIAAMSLFRFAADNASWSYPGVEQPYLLAQKIVSTCACILSIFGAFIVIFSFLYESETGLKWKEVYKLCCGYRVTETVEKADEDGNIIEEVTVTKYKVKSYHIILINQSIADLVVASSHLWGLYSDTFSLHSKNESAISSGYNITCTIQAAFTAISTMSSFFWTDILAVFLAFNIVFSHCTNNHWTGEVDAKRELQIINGVEIPAKHNAPNCCETPFFLYFLFPVIGWGLPIAMTVVLAAQNRLGYTEDYNTGNILLDSMCPFSLFFWCVCVGGEFHMLMIWQRTMHQCAVLEFKKGDHFYSY